MNAVSVVTVPTLTRIPMALTGACGDEKSRQVKFSFAVPPSSLFLCFLAEDAIASSFSSLLIFPFSFSFLFFHRLYV